MLTLDGWTVTINTCDSLVIIAIHCKTPEDAQKVAKLIEEEKTLNVQMG